MESPSDEEFELNRSNANANSNTNSYLTEQGKTYRPSHWFLGAIVGLFAVLLLGIASSYLVLLRGSLQPRVGLITGSSMEPTLRGPRAEFDCQACGSKSSWTMDTLDPSNEVSCQRCKAYLDTSYPTLVPEIGRAHV